MQGRLSTMKLAILVLMSSVGVAMAEVQVIGGRTTVPLRLADCRVAVNSLLPCLPYVMGEGKPFPPGGLKKCCENLSAAVDREPVCLCSVLNRNPSTLINIIRVKELPGICNIAAVESFCPGGSTRTSD